MHKDPYFSDPFYTSTVWKKCRSSYLKNVGGFCEKCLKKGLIVPGEEVHHKVRLTPENINDPSVALNWDNLELLCRECHIREHRERKRRYDFDEEGRLILPEDEG